MARKHLIIHVGRQKTGTSALQNFLCRKEKALGAEGIIYPYAGRKNTRGNRAPAHHFIADLCNRSVTKPVFWQTQQEFFDEVEPYHTVLVSSEAFQNVKSPGKLRTFFRDFRDFDVTVVAYFREYLSFLISAFAQRTQNQLVFSKFSDYCRRDLWIRKSIDIWSSVGHLICRPYDKECLRNGNIVDDFLYCLHIELSHDSLQTYNPSIGGNLLFFKLASNYLNMDFLTYNEQSILANKNPRFRGAFYVDKNRAFAIRSSSDYNRQVEKVTGELPLRDFDQFAVVPENERIISDYEEIAERYPKVLPEEQYLQLAERARAWF